MVSPVAELQKKCFVRMLMHIIKLQVFPQEVIFKQNPEGCSGVCQTDGRCRNYPGKVKKVLKSVVRSRWMVRLGERKKEGGWSWKASRCLSVLCF